MGTESQRSGVLRPIDFRPWFPQKYNSRWTAFVQPALINSGQMKDKQNSMLRHLCEPGLDPQHFPNEKLFYWTVRPRNPVLACNDDLANMFIQAKQVSILTF